MRLIHSPLQKSQSLYKFVSLLLRYNICYNFGFMALKVTNRGKGLNTSSQTIKRVTKKSAQNKIRMERTAKSHPKVKQRPPSANTATTEASVTSRIRRVGNSSGVILTSQLIKTAGLNPEAEILINAHQGMITIMQVDPEVNTDLNTWDKQFRTDIKKGNKPEGDFFETMGNQFDEKEW